VSTGVPTPLLCIDSFTTEPFRGNPAAVCLLDEALNEARMQAIAAEMNLSETAFVVPGDDAYDLRWFTPEVEVVLCGHGTLASAHALYETGRADRGEAVRFKTRWRGILVASAGDDGIALDFPAAPPTPQAAPAGLAEALGAAPVAVGANDLHHVVELSDATAVARLVPDIAALGRIEAVEAVAVTARADEPGIDFVSRYFAPRYGIAEDPVTGSAHTSLGPWWAERLGTTQLVGKQLSERTGIVHVRVGHPAADRVTIAGRAVTVWRGELLV
jgi:PhzF family phenazine biosynthesis protein